MIYYFSGAYNQKLKRELNIDQLFSVYLERKLIIETLQYKKEHPEYTARIMVDSGAFSFYQQSKKKGHILTDQEMQEYTNSYIEFLNQYGDDIEVFVGVDTVPDPEHVDPTFVHKTWANYLYMYSKLKPEIKHKLMPVFHFGEDFNELKNWLEYKHEDGTSLDYLGLAISLEGTTKVRIKWANQCRKLIESSSNPHVKTHAFGVGVKSVLDYINVTSTDATSWVKRAAYGMISINDKSITISDVAEQKIGGKHYTEKSLAYSDEVEKLIKDKGFTVEELKTDTYARARFNILDTLDWVSKIKDKPVIKREELW